MHEHAQPYLHATLKYCSQCDVTYCTNCKREWGQYPQYPVYVRPTIWPTWWPYWAGGTGGTTDPYPMTTTTVGSYDSPSSDLFKVCSHQ